MKLIFDDPRRTVPSCPTSYVYMVLTKWERDNKICARSAAEPIFEGFVYDKDCDLVHGDTIEFSQELTEKNLTFGKVELDESYIGGMVYQCGVYLK